MKYPLEKIANIKLVSFSGGTPLTSVAEYYDPPAIPWLKTKEVNYKPIYQTETSISELGLKNSNAKLVPVNSIIIAMYGQGDTAGRVAINKIPLTTNQACFNLVVDPEKADYRFVYYALVQSYEALVTLKNGGAQPNLSAYKLNNFEIPCPNLGIQQSIGKILSDYDDLIDVNRRRIAVLEEMAMRTYREWFLHFRFPGYETTPLVDGLPHGWKIGLLELIGKFKRGKNITTSEAIEGEIPVVAGGINPSCFHNESNTIAPVITVSASGANAGYTRLYQCDVWAADCSFLDAACPNVFFVYCFLKTYKALTENLQRGSAQPHVHAKDLNSLKCVVPNGEIIKSFCEFVKPLFEQIKNIELTISRLQQMRDRLLPQLMSGQLEVKL